MIGFRSKLIVAFACVTPLAMLVGVGYWAPELLGIAMWGILLASFLGFLHLRSASVRSMSYLIRAEQCIERGLLGQAERDLAKARDRAESAWFNAGARLTYAVELAGASLAVEQRNAGAAETAARRALQLAGRRQQLRALALLRLASAHCLARRYKEAVPCLREAAGRLDNNLMGAVVAQRTLGFALLMTGRPRDAEALFFEILGRVARSDDDNSRRMAATCHSGLGLREARRKCWEESARRYRRAASLLDGIDPEAGLLLKSAIAVDLACAEVRMGHHTDAERRCREVIDASARDEMSHKRIASAVWVNLAEALFGQGRIGEAREAADKALEAIAASDDGSDDQEIGDVHDTLAKILAEQGNCEQAALHYEVAVGRRSRQRPPYNLSESLERFAAVCEHLRRPAEAEALRERAAGAREEEELAWS